MTWVDAPPPGIWSIRYERWDGDTYDAPVTWIVSLLAYFMFYIFSFSFIPITCIFSLIWLDLYFHAFSSSVFSSCFFGDFNISPLQFYLYHGCLFFLFSLITLMRRNTFIFLMYVPLMDLNPWFCVDVSWKWLAYRSVSNLFDQFPLEAGVSYKRIWLPGFFHSPTSYKAKNYCESPWIWDSGEGVVFRMF